MSDVDMITWSSEDAAARLDELLDEASGNPIGITGRDDLMAYLVFRSDYEAMLERIQFLEDQLWLSKADAARKEGHADKKRVDAFLRDFSEGANHEKAAVVNSGGAAASS